MNNFGHNHLIMSGSRWIIFLLFTFIISGGKSARILAYFPTPSISHQVVFRPLVHALAERGHEVMVVTADPVFPKGQAPGNLTEIDVHDISYEIWRDFAHNLRETKQDLIKQSRLLLEKAPMVVDKQLEILEVKEILKKDRKYFDLLLLEACIRPLMGFSYIFDAPVILISSFGAVPIQYEYMGAPGHPLLYPTPGRKRLYNISLLEKVTEFFNMVLLGFLFFESEVHDNRIIQKHFGDDIPSYGELTNKIQMMFLNEHPIWADNRPVPPSILYIGGIHQPKEKELPTDLKNILDSSKHGVVYVSFGTNVMLSVLPQEKIQIMCKVFSELPYDILWKNDEDSLISCRISENIKLFKWFPQTDVLRHPNIKLFITQGGLQSTDEAIDATVPLIGIPILADQWYNVEKYVKHNIGLQLDISTLTEQSLKNSIEKVINNISFKNNITRLRSIMRETPIKPLDNAIWWTEHVIKHGGSHLRSPAANMSRIEYYEIKLSLIILSILGVIIALLYLLICLIFKCVFKVNRTKYKLKMQ